MTVASGDPTLTFEYVKFVLNRNRVYVQSLYVGNLHNRHQSLSCAQVEGVHQGTIG